MMTSVMPTATTKLMEICCDTFRKLLLVRNTGDAIARSRHSAASAIRMPITLFEEPTFLTCCFLDFALRAAAIMKPPAPMIRRSITTTHSMRADAFTELRN